MESQPKRSLRDRIRPVLITAIALAVLAQILVLSPKSLEHRPPTSQIAPEALIVVDDTQKTLAKGLPRGAIPEYTIQDFQYVSSQAGVKQWKLLAQKAYLYQQHQLVHGTTVTAHLYDEDEKITIVTGKEAKYDTNQRDLEVYGDVVTTFPDGFQVRSDYMRYLPNERRIEIPLQFDVVGGGQKEPEQHIAFSSLGMSMKMDEGLITLPQRARVVMTRRPPKDAAKDTIPEKTTIDSDHCLINRKTQVAHFTMSAKRPIEQRFVHTEQPNMTVRSRRSDLNYGDYAKVLQYMIAYEDVTIREKGPSEKERYATGGRASFDNRRNVIVLKEYPQVYQGNDTVTGDTIIVHRDTDIVEVEHSNAFSEGQP